jgi:hypothetical protein
MTNIVFRGIFAMTQSVLDASHANAWGHLERTTEAIYKNVDGQF